jgi:hypothetical protein
MAIGIDKLTQAEAWWLSLTRHLMVAMLAALTIFFFCVTLYQLTELNRKIEDSPRLEPAELLRQTGCPDSLSQSDCVVLRRTKLAAMLEANTIARRYHQANVILMSSIWSRYLGFVTGMILALVGAAFILGRLRDTGTELEGSAANARAAIKSTSPGIVLATLGVLLMISTIVTLHQLNTRDAALYFDAETATSDSIYHEVVPRENDQKGK